MQQYNPLKIMNFIIRIIRYILDKFSFSSSTSSVSVGVGTDENETYGCEEQKDHPLLNDVILKKLFEFVRAKDLKACRLVCKKWCVLTLPSCRSKFRVKLHGNNEEMTRRLTDFIEVYRLNTLGIPFVEYKLDPFCTTEGPGKEFLQICGSTATTIYLWPRTHHDLKMEVEVKDISELLKAMPNIEVFSISHRILSRSGNTAKLFSDDVSTKPKLTFLKKLVVYDDDEDETSDYCPTFIEEILHVAPNISDLRVNDSKLNLERSRIGQVLKAIEKFERESVIRNLDLSNTTVEHLEHLRRLADNGMKLETLRLYTLRHVIELPGLATLFKNSIVSLEVQEDCECLSFIELPHMPKLKILGINVCDNFDSKAVNLNKLFPALKELYLFSTVCHDNGWEEFLSNSELCTTVNSFCVYHPLKFQAFDHIFKIFPKLTRLGLEVTSDGVQILTKIMTEMTQLEDLYLEGTVEGIENIDAFLTGLPVQKVQELQQIVTELKNMTVHLRRETIQYYRSQYCQFPSIANLTNLRCLTLYETNGRGVERENEPMDETRITDVFGYFGLYSMKHINELQIDGCEFTKAACEILTVEMELESWRFHRDGIDPDRRRASCTISYTANESMSIAIQRGNVATVLGSCRLGKV